MEMLDTLDAEAIRRLKAAGTFFWLDLHGPSDEDIDRLAELFDLHPLAVEDTKNFDQRPKLEEFEGRDQIFLVFYGVRGGSISEAVPVEVHFFLSGDAVVTVHREPCDDFPDVARRLDAEARTEQFVVYRILDALTDSFFPVLEHFDDQLDELEEAIAAQPDDAQLQRLFALKRRLVTLRKIVTPQRDIFARATDAILDLRGLEKGSRDYFRDVYDHLIRISDLIDSYRDVLSGATDMYLSIVSNRLNLVMERLTLLATVLIPLTVITGFFGQNFGWLVRHINTLWSFLVFGIGGLVVPIAALMWWFWREGWITSASRRPGGERPGTIAARR